MISNKVSQQGHSASQTSRQIVSLAYFLVQRRDSKADQILEMSIVRFPLQTSQILPGLGKVHYFHFETCTKHQPRIYQTHVACVGRENLQFQTNLLNLALLVARQVVRNPTFTFDSSTLTNKR